jgi:hypothetical protein
MSGSKIRICKAEFEKRIKRIRNTDYDFCGSGKLPSPRRLIDFQRDLWILTTHVGINKNDADCTVLPYTFRNHFLVYSLSDSPVEYIRK